MPKFGFQITIEDNLDEIIARYGLMRKEEIPKATRSALNKGMDTQFTGFTKAIRKRRKIKLKDLKRFVKKRPVRAKNVDRMESRVEISGRKVGTINFVIGKKEPRKQKGISVRKRRRIRIEIKPGRRKVKKDAFIAKGKGGKYQLFQRRTKRSKPIVRQAVTAVSNLARNPSIKDPIQSQSRVAMRREFFRVLNVEFTKNRTKGRLKVRTG